MQHNHLYNIVLQNNTGSRQKYVFLCDPPEDNGSDMHAIAWINADVAQNGTYTVSTTDQVFACEHHSEEHEPRTRWNSINGRY